MNDCSFSFWQVSKFRNLFFLNKNCNMFLSVHYVFLITILFCTENFFALEKELWEGILEYGPTAMALKLIEGNKMLKKYRKIFTLNISNNHKSLILVELISIELLTGSTEYMGYMDFFRWDRRLRHLSVQMIQLC